MLKILVLGATSAIVQETVKHFAADGADLFLVGRNVEKLRIIHDDLTVRGAKRVTLHPLDLNQLAEHPALIETAIQTLNGLDVVLMGHGTLPDQKVAQAEVALTLAEIQTNFLSAVSLLTLVANYMEKQRRGAIAVISSVAGDRGRGSNYIYGAAMAGKTAFLQGLRNRLAKSGVTVLTVKPGFVNTPMTANVKKNRLFADPEDVGLAIYKAMKSGKDVIYVPFFWRYIMMVIIHLPEFIFKRLSL